MLLDTINAIKSLIGIAIVVAIGVAIYMIWNNGACTSEPFATVFRFLQLCAGKKLGEGCGVDTDCEGETGCFESKCVPKEDVPYVGSGERPMCDASKSKAECQETGAHNCNLDTDCKGWGWGIGGEGVCCHEHVCREASMCPIKSNPLTSMNPLSEEDENGEPSLGEQMVDGGEEVLDAVVDWVESDPIPAHECEPTWVNGYCSW